MLFALTIVALMVAINTADDTEAAGNLSLVYLDDHLPQDPLVHHFNLTYIGQTPGKVDVHPSGVPEGFAYELKAETSIGNVSATDILTLYFHRHETWSLTIVFHLNGTVLAGTHEMSLWAFANEDPYDSDAVAFLMPISQFADAHIEVYFPPPGGTYKAIPPSTITIRYILFNTGNGADRFKIRASSSLSYRGWTPSFVHGVDWNGTTDLMPPDPLRRTAYYIDIKVPIPAGEVSGRVSKVELMVTSLFNTSVESMAPPLDIESLQYFNFQVFIKGSDEMDAMPGDIAVFRLDIRNLGNNVDNFIIRSRRAGDAQHPFFVTVEPGTIEIEANTSAIVAIVVEVPDNALKSTYFFEVEVWSSSKELTPVVKVLAVRVLQTYGVEIGKIQEVPTAVPGETVITQVSVFNSGNGFDVVSVDPSTKPAGWVTLISPEQVALTTNEEANVSVSVIVSSYHLWARSGPHAVALIATCSDGRTQMVLELSVRVRTVHRVELAFDNTNRTSPETPDVTTPTILMNPNSAVVNHGNNDATTLLSIESSHALLWATVSSYTVRVNWSSWDNITLVLKAQRDLPPGEYEVILMVRPATSTDEMERSITLPVVVFERNFVLTGLDVLVNGAPSELLFGIYQAVEGDGVRLDINMTYVRPLEGNLVTVNVWHTFPNGTRIVHERYSEYLQTGEGQTTLFVTLTAMGTGTHIFEVEASMPMRVGTDVELDRVVFTVNEWTEEPGTAQDDSPGLVAPIAMLALALVGLLSVRRKLSK